MQSPPKLLFLFFLAVPTSTQIYTLSLHDALPISPRVRSRLRRCRRRRAATARLGPSSGSRSEEHTSELQSHHDLVCRLLLEKKNKRKAPGFRIELYGWGRRERRRRKRMNNTSNGR